MIDTKGLIEDLKRINEVWDHFGETEVGRLILRIMAKDAKTDDEWIQLQEDVNEYVNSYPPEADLKRLMEYTESLNMICSGIKLKRRYIFCPLYEESISMMDCLTKRNVVGNADGTANPEEFKKSSEWNDYCRYCIYTSSSDYFNVA